MKKPIGNCFNQLINISIGISLIALGIYFFLIPSNSIVGSVSGLAIVVNVFSGIPVSVLTLVFNIVLLILGLIFVGKEFGFQSIYTSVMLPCILGILEYLFPNNHSLTNDPVLDVVCFVFIVCMGQTILFRANASSGGFDILAMILHKYYHVDLGKAVAWIGMCVAVTSIFVYDSKSVIISILATYLSGIVLDNFIMGFDLKKRVCIISKRNDVIRDYICNTLQCRAAVYKMTDVCSDSLDQEIIAIVNQNEYSKLIKFVEETDDHAYITVYKVNKIIH